MAILTNLFEIALIPRTKKRSVTDGDAKSTIWKNVQNFICEEFNEANNELILVWNAIFFFIPKITFYFARVFNH